MLASSRIVEVSPPPVQHVNTTEKNNNEKIRFLDFMFQVLVFMSQKYVNFSNKKWGHEARLARNELLIFQQLENQLFENVKMKSE